MNLFVGGMISGLIFLILTLLTGYFTKNERDWMINIFSKKFR